MEQIEEMKYITVLKSNNVNKNKYYKVCLNYQGKRIFKYFSYNKIGLIDAKKWRDDKLAEFIEERNAKTFKGAFITSLSVIKHYYNSDKSYPYCLIYDIKAIHEKQQNSDRVVTPDECLPYVEMFERKLKYLLKTNAYCFNPNVESYLDDYYKNGMSIYKISDKTREGGKKGITAERVRQIIIITLNKLASAMYYDELFNGADVTEYDIARANEANETTDSRDEIKVVKQKQKNVKQRIPIYKMKFLSENLFSTMKAAGIEYYDDIIEMGLEKFSKLHYMGSAKLVKIVIELNKKGYYFTD